jgi:endonuclease/exonuclease/phosphatase family metal-dependent hydrolase
MRLTIMTLNLKCGGLADAAGNPEDRWPGLAAIISGQAPDVLALQEATGRWAEPGQRQLARAEHDLGLRGRLGASPSGGHTAIFWQPDLTWLAFDDRYSSQTHHGYAAIVLHVPGTDVPLTVISAHLSPWSAQAAAQEAQLLTGRAYRYGGLGVIAGDINHLPLGDDEPDWTLPLPAHNLAARTLGAAPGGPVTGNRCVGEVLAAGQMTDAAAWHAGLTGDQSLRAPTGANIRADQVHLTPPLVPALTACQRIATGDLSDHAAVTVTLDTTLIDQARTPPRY